MNAFQVNQVQYEHQERTGNDFQRESFQGLQCAREDAWGPNAGLNGQREHCGGRGHHPGERHLPPLQICGAGEGPTYGGQPEGQPQECQTPQSAQTTGQEIAAVEKTVANLIKMFEQVVGGGQQHQIAAGGDGGQNAANPAQTGGGDQATSRNIQAADNSITPSTPASVTDNPAPLAASDNSGPASDAPATPAPSAPSTDTDFGATPSTSGGDDWSDS